MIKTNEIQKFNELLASYEPKEVTQFNFHRQKEITNLIVKLEQQKEKAVKEMEKATMPLKREVLALHKQYEKEARRMGIVSAEPRRERKNDSGYKFAYYKTYLQYLLPFGNNKRFSLEDFRKAVKDGQKEKIHHNRLINMATDGLIKKLNDEGTLFSTPSSNPEKGNGTDRDEEWTPATINQSVERFSQ
tara:strand:+ start:181 stop:747 length:567 start_codon:yes stop_codon:yes gene_type:complete